MPNNATGVITVLVIFGVGSRNEADHQAGISHVLEHMHYKGTKKLPTPIDVAEFIENVGGEHNAFTGKEYTGYYAKIVPKHLETALEFLKEIVVNPLFDRDSLEREKGVIVEEINMYEDLPMEIVDSRFEEVIFGSNALGRDVIGRKEAVLAVQRDDLINYREKYYTAPNTVVVMAGNFGGKSEEEMVRLAEENFVLPHKKIDALPAVTINNKKASIVINRSTEQSHLVVGFRGAEYRNAERYILKLLAVILGGSMSSRMFTEIREKRGLAYAVRTSSSSYVESGGFDTQAGVPHEKVKETIQAILDEYRKALDSGVTEAELNRAKEIANGRMLVSFEDSLEVAEYYAISEILSAKVVTIPELMKIYEKISRDDILSVARKYLTDERMGLAYIGPSLTKGQLEDIFVL